MPSTARRWVCRVCTNITLAAVATANWREPRACERGAGGGQHPPAHGETARAAGRPAVKMPCRMRNIGGAFSPHEVVPSHLGGAASPVTPWSAGRWPARSLSCRKLGWPHFDIPISARIRCPPPSWPTARRKLRQRSSLTPVWTWRDRRRSVFTTPKHHGFTRSGGSGARDSCCSRMLASARPPHLGTPGSRRSGRH